MRKLNASSLQKEAVRLYSKELKTELLIGRSIYSFGRFLFTCLKPNQPPLDDAQFAAMVLLTRSLDNFKVIHTLSKQGYYSSAATIGCSIIEHMCLMRRFCVEPKSATDWRNHLKPTNRFKIRPGKDGEGCLTAKFFKNDCSGLIKLYETLSGIKHMNAQTISLNYKTTEQISQVFGEPLLDVALTRQILKITQLPMVLVLQDFKQICGNIILWNERREERWRVLSARAIKSYK